MIDIFSPFQKSNYSVPFSAPFMIKQESSLSSIPHKIYIINFSTNNIYNIIEIPWSGTDGSNFFRILTKINKNGNFLIDINEDGNSGLGIVNIDKGLLTNVIPANLKDMFIYSAGIRPPNNYRTETLSNGFIFYAHHPPAFNTSGRAIYRMSDDGNIVWSKSLVHWVRDIIAHESSNRVFYYEPDDNRLRGLTLDNGNLFTSISTPDDLISAGLSMSNTGHHCLMGAVPSNLSTRFGVFYNPNGTYRTDMTFQGQEDTDILYYGSRITPFNEHFLINGGRSGVGWEPYLYLYDIDNNIVWTTADDPIGVLDEYKWSSDFTINSKLERVVSHFGGRIVTRNINNGQLINSIDLSNNEEYFLTHGRRSVLIDENGYITVTSGSTPIIRITLLSPNLVPISTFDIPGTDADAYYNFE